MMPRKSNWPLVIMAVWVLILATVPTALGNYEMRIAISIAMFTALALSWNFIGGYTGYPSFSTAAFYGIGCYVGALAQRNGVPAAAAWLAAAGVGGGISWAIGSVVLRLKGHYFAIGSIALVDVSRLVVSSWGSLTGGGDGLNVPLLDGRPPEVSGLVLKVMLFIMVCAFIANVIVDRTRLGFGLRCIEQNEDAADMVGINATRYKTAAYVLSAVFPAAVGAVYASWVGYIDPTDSFAILLTIKVPVMVLLGGAGTLLGPVVGAVAFILLEEVFWANFLEWNRAIMGAIIVLLIFFLPGGLLKLDYRGIIAGVQRRLRPARAAVQPERKAG